MVKDFQEEMNERAQSKLADFHKYHKHLTKDRKESEPISKEDADKLLQEYEQGITEALEQGQTVLESRLIRQHLKWVLPWFQTVRATELVQFTQVHAVGTLSSPFCQPK